MERPFATLEEDYLEQVSATANDVAHAYRRAGVFGLAWWAKRIEVDAAIELAFRARLVSDRARDQLALFDLPGSPPDA